MIIDLKLSWKQKGTEAHGDGSRYRFGLDDEILSTYEAMGRPHGEGFTGLGVFIGNLIRAAIDQSGSGPFSLLGTVPKLPGYEPVIDVNIVALSEEALAPVGALPAYHLNRPNPGIYTEDQILALAPLDENGRKLAYIGLFCKFWATSPEDCGPCPHGSEICAGHCPHCGGPLAAVGLEDHLERTRSLPTAYHALVLTAYAGNCTTCHGQLTDYRGELEGVGERLRDAAALKAAEAPGPGRYAHILPEADPLAARTCPTCEGEAVPVALRAQGSKREGEEDPAWLLTWVCNGRHYNHKAPGWIAPWPFAEAYATAQDLAAAGFKVIQ